MITGKSLPKKSMKPEALPSFLSLLMAYAVTFAAAFLQPLHTHASSPVIAAEGTFNKGASRGDMLFLTLRLDDGEKVLFAVDTGAPGTLLDKSLAPKLGKRIGPKTLRTLFYGIKTADAYWAPALYLGDTRLVLGRTVETVDFRRVVPYFDRPLMGILGMDCLKHYCVQLDFEESKIRLLASLPQGDTDWGEAFSCKIRRGVAFAYADFFGVKNAPFNTDTGCPSADFMLTKAFGRTLSKQKCGWTNVPANETSLPKLIFGGETYTNITVGEYEGPWLGARNLIGLSFLARHLVTLDFPNGKMYLKRLGDKSVHKDEPSKNRDFTQGWWEAGNASMSNSCSALLAQAIVSAPNLRPDATFSDFLVWAHLQPQFQPLWIQSGAPEARLSAVQLPPGDHKKIRPKKTRLADSSEILWMECFDDKGNATAPVSERGTVFLLHDYNSQKEFMKIWAFALAQAGYRAVLVDLRGHGESTGQIISYGKYEVADLKQVLDDLEQRHICNGKIGVLGIGYGASLALHWAARDSRVGTVVAIAPNNQPEQVFERMAGEHKVSLSPGLLPETLHLVASQLGIEWADWSAEAALHQIKEPALLIGGGKDAISTTNDFRLLEQALPTGSKTILLPEATHKNIGFWFELAEPVEAWFQQHLPGQVARGNMDNK